jgi:hypothetical protein
LLLSHGWILAVALVGAWIYFSARARRTLGDRRTSLALLTETQRLAHREAAREFLVEVIEAADRGDPLARAKLLERWHSLLPASVRPFSVQIGRTAPGECQLTGRAIGPGDIPTETPRIGRGGKTVYDKRKVGEVDEDLTELNAAAALSLLLAMFGDADRVHVHLSLSMDAGAAGMIPWIRLATHLGYTELQTAIAGMQSPSEALRTLGGMLGRRKAQRYYPAEDPQLVGTAGSASQDEEVSAVGDPPRNGGWTKATPQRKDGIGPDPDALRAGMINPEREGKVLEAIRLGVGSTVESLMAATGLREPTVRHFGLSAAEAGLVEALKIGTKYHFIVTDADPAASPGARKLRASVLAQRASENATQGRQAARVGFAPVAIPVGVAAPAVSATEKVPSPGGHRRAVPDSPAPRHMRGRFGVVAKRWAAYECSPATFVPFQHYYPTYECLDPAQLAFYFGWRTAFRQGNVLQTDLSYLFIHVYELIHVIGVPDLRHAASELERLWTSYRSAFPKLDRYLVPWIADLYATENLAPEISGWYKRSAAAGAGVADAEVIADLYWADADYQGMPRLALTVLTGEPKLGANKFCLQYNADGWVERGYREALEAADEAFRAKQGKPVRDATIEAHGLRPLTREAFAGAVYDWKRVRVTVARTPSFDDTSLAVLTFQAAARYAENRMREQRKFKARLRGVTIDSELAAAIDQRLGRYIEASRPRTRVTIDLAKARELEQESSEVREILLAGSTGAEAPAPEGAPPGLLTDLAAVRSAIEVCSAPARALLEPFVAYEWELPASDPRLVSAAGGALVGPLVDEVNGHTMTSLGDLLIVPEGELYVLQEDFRDEVYCAIRGSLEGFGIAPPESPSSQPAYPNAVSDADSFGFGPAELQTLRLLSGAQDATSALEEHARAEGSTVLLLLDRVNELALASPHGDNVVDTGGTPPALIDDGREWVAALLAHFPVSQPEPSTER